MSDYEQAKVFAQNLSHYVNACGKLQKDIAKELEIPQQTFNGWCNGVSIPTMGKVQKLADYFHIGKTDLLDKKSDYPAPMTDEEHLIIQCYRKLDSSQKEMLKRMIAYYEKDGKNLNERK